MAGDRGDELRALRTVIELCRAQAIALDMPGLEHILSRAESSLASHLAAPPPQIPRGRALSVPRGRIVRH
ncbi:hypothetical protein [Lichenibacterium dinghuense]|uniref:hypothetical protein n=1 Tax=Lichenibacterium dinghuense TaxID=2895977 RepID=UPI001F3992AE|nr:hypothetical protein [Lichenibacterium sp. 6Y81]